MSLSKRVRYFLPVEKEDNKNDGPGTVNGCENDECVVSIAVFFVVVVVGLNENISGSYGIEIFWGFSGS